MPVVPLEKEKEFFKSRNSHDTQQFARHMLDDGPPTFQVKACQDLGGRSTQQNVEYYLGRGQVSTEQEKTILTYTIFYSTVLTFEFVDSKIVKIDQTGF